MPVGRIIHDYVKPQTQTEEEQKQAADPAWARQDMRRLQRALIEALPDAPVSEPKRRKLTAEELARKTRMEKQKKYLHDRAKDRYAKRFRHSKIPIPDPTQKIERQRQTQLSREKQQRISDVRIKKQEIAARVHGEKERSRRQEHKRFSQQKRADLERRKRGQAESRKAHDLALQGLPTPPPVSAIHIPTETTQVISRVKDLYIPTQTTQPKILKLQMDPRVSAIKVHGSRLEPRVSDIHVHGTRQQIAERNNSQRTHVPVVGDRRVSGSSSTPSNARIDKTHKPIRSNSSARNSGTLGVLGPGISHRGTNKNLFRDKQKNKIPTRATSKPVSVRRDIMTGLSPGDKAHYRRIQQRDNANVERHRNRLNSLDEDARRRMTVNPIDIAHGDTKMGTEYEQSQKRIAERMKHVPEMLKRQKEEDIDRRKKWEADEKIRISQEKSESARRSLSLKRKQNERLHSEKRRLQKQQHRISRSLSREPSDIPEKKPRISELPDPTADFQKETELGSGSRLPRRRKTEIQNINKRVTSIDRSLKSNDKDLEEYRKRSRTSDRETSWYREQNHKRMQKAKRRYSEEQKTDHEVYKRMQKRDETSGERFKKRMHSLSQERKKTSRPPLDFARQGRFTDDIVEYEKARQKMLEEQKKETANQKRIQIANKEKENLLKKQQNLTQEVQQVGISKQRVAKVRREIDNVVLNVKRQETKIQNLKRETPSLPFDKTTVPKVSDPSVAYRREVTRQQKPGRKPSEVQKLPRWSGQIEQKVVPVSHAEIEEAQQSDANYRRAQQIAAQKKKELEKKRAQARIAQFGQAHWTQQQLRKKAHDIGREKYKAELARKRDAGKPKPQEYGTAEFGYSKEYYPQFPETKRMEHLGFGDTQKSKRNADLNRRLMSKYGFTNINQLMHAFSSEKLKMLQDDEEKYQKGLFDPFDALGLDLGPVTVSPGERPQQSSIPIIKTAVLSNVFGRLLSVSAQPLCFFRRLLFDVPWMQLAFLSLDVGVCRELLCLVLAANVFFRHFSVLLHHPLSCLVPLLPPLQYFVSAVLPILPFLFGLLVLAAVFFVLP